MVPTCHETLYTGRILQIYIVLSLILLVILILFYAMFLLMANSLNRNARLPAGESFSPAAADAVRQPPHRHRGSQTGAT